MYVTMLNSILMCIFDLNNINSNSEKSTLKYNFEKILKQYFCNEPNEIVLYKFKKKNYYVIGYIVKLSIY